jgi:hypothetical protein
MKIIKVSIILVVFRRHTLKNPIQVSMAQKPKIKRLQKPFVSREHRKFKSI